MEKINDKTTEVQGTDGKGAEIKQIKPAKPSKEEQAKLLAKTVKTIDDLYKKIKHRDRLEQYSEQLEEFELKKQDEDIEQPSYYQGCIFYIKDDNNNKFELRHPGIIKEIVGFLQGRFQARLTELESQIKLPA